MLTKNSSKQFFWGGGDYFLHCIGEKKTILLVLKSIWELKIDKITFQTTVCIFFFQLRSVSSSPAALLLLTIKMFLLLFIGLSGKMGQDPGWHWYFDYSHTSSWLWRFLLHRDSSRMRGTLKYSSSPGPTKIPRLWTHSWRLWCQIRW